MKTCLLFLFAVVYMLACKKETKEITEINSSTTTTAGKPNCWGNFWQNDIFFYGHPDNSTLHIPISLVYNNKLYLFDASQDLVRIYNGTSWNNIASSVPFPGFDPPNFGFTIGSKGYLGNIDMNSLTHPFWEYDFVANTWTQKSNFPGERRVQASASSFSIGTKGYLVSGLGELNNNALTLKDTWEYDPANNSWIQKADLPLSGRAAYASGFSTSNKGYIVAGKYITENSTTHLKALMEYDPVPDTWTSKAQFPGSARYHPSVFVISGTVYAGCGRTQNTFFKDFYKYSPGNNSWLQVADVLVTNPSVFGFSINSNGYLEFIDQAANPNFMLKYTPRSCYFPTTPN